MDRQSAKAAGDIAAQIDAVEAMMVQVQRAIDGGWQICALRAVDPKTGEDTNLLAAPTIGREKSQAGLKFVQETYQAQLDDLKSQLGGM